MTRIRLLLQSLADGSSVVYLLVVLMTVYDVAARFLLAQPTTWALELSILLCGAQYMCACAASCASGGMIRMTGFIGKFPRTVQKFGQALSVACGLLFLGALTWAAWAQAKSSVLALETSGSLLNSPTPMILKVAILVAAASMLVTEVFAHRTSPASKGEKSHVD